jgi:hypothetical protein
MREMRLVHIMNDQGEDGRSRAWARPDDRGSRESSGMPCTLMRHSRLDLNVRLSTGAAYFCFPQVNPLTTISLKKQLGHGALIGESAAETVRCNETSQSRTGTTFPPIDRRPHLPGRPPQTTLPNGCHVRPNRVLKASPLFCPQTSHQWGPGASTTIPPCRPHISLSLS